MSSQSSNSADSGDEADGRAERCTRRHRTMFVPCETAVVYEIPFTCGKCYIGQTQNCVNERLRQHQNGLLRALSNAAGNAGGGGGGTLVQHYLDCDDYCIPHFHSCKVIAADADREVRERMEAIEIRQAGARCVSYPSVVPSEYPDMSKTHLRDESESDSESGSESESDSESGSESESDSEPGSESESDSESGSESESDSESGSESESDSESGSESESDSESGSESESDSESGSESESD
ncbi:uncharacterized protein [Dermacentor andersoni]|uniref:uncharacterized protein n=1 Tax=Dermacentor andersoni TaxID=34620 RepID=UPI003B3A9A6F